MENDYSELRIDPLRGGSRFGLRVTPGSGSDIVVGPFGGRLRVRVRAPAEKGRANRAVLRLLAAVLEVPEGKVEILTGYTSRDKTILVRGLAPDEVVARLTREDG